MTNEYSRVGSALKPVELTGAQLQAMGRIIRAVAEIEDIITLHMCNLAEITEGQAIILMGRTNISTKLKLSFSLANALGGEAKRITDECFDNEAYRALMKCRNAIAHGLLLGQTDTGKIAFRTSTASLQGETVGIEVATYEPSAFAQFAEIAELAIQQIEGPLRVQELREARREQSLERHSKAQPTRAPSAKPMRQRKPHREKRKDKPLKGR